MITRIEGGSTYTQVFDTENRLTSITVGGQVTQFIYDPDGNLVKKIKPDGSKTLYVAGVYEVDKNSSGTVTGTKTYYSAGGAMRIGSTLYYVLKDHLGSASAVTDTSGNTISGGEARYYPFGESRFSTAPMLTDKLFTGQREMTGLGIYYYGARFYSPSINRFLSADSIVPGYANPQNLNRFSYVRNNPLRYTDPTGHGVDCGIGMGCVSPYVPPYIPPPPVNYCTTHPGACGGGGGGGGSSGSTPPPTAPPTVPPTTPPTTPIPPLNPSTTPTPTPGGANTYDCFTHPTSCPTTPTQSSSLTQNPPNQGSGMCSANPNGCMLAGALLIALTDVFIGIPAAAVIILSGGVTPPALAAEALETFVVLPINILGIYLIAQGAEARRNEE